MIQAQVKPLVLMTSSFGCLWKRKYQKKSTSNQGNHLTHMYTHIYICMFVLQIHQTLVMRGIYWPLAVETKLLEYGVQAKGDNSVYLECQNQGVTIKEEIKMLGEGKFGWPWHGHNQIHGRLFLDHSSRYHILDVLQFSIFYKEILTDEWSGVELWCFMSHSRYIHVGRIQSAWRWPPDL